MAGTLPFLPLSMQFDKDTGKQLKGGKLYFFQANTVATPQDSFRDAVLADVHPNPITLDGAGRIPMFYLADGSVHVRLTNAAGVVQFDEMNALVIGASGGGGGVDTTDPNSVAGTGDWKFRMGAGSISGWTRANGRTIGAALSGATERANADCQAQFTYLYEFDDIICPVIGGRGANAAADWAANKQITIPDCRFRAPFGLDDMGNLAANRSTGALFTVGTGPVTPGGSGGEPAVVLTQAHLPSATLATTIPAGQGLHDHAAQPGFASAASGGDLTARLATGAPSTGVIVPATLPAMSGTTALGGSNSAHNNMPGFVLGTWYVRL
ncbi:hypothetical protein RA307_04720 [Xanthobacteraceae bacterium Astr-EGSB]|uniref:hypothetical protein n=1 Tax=Astrobacterium formosum TaxID=3069710 RepID=UPI0027B42A82|nr:hypothetical protein [Xanthobacteraceae bacterium Astr-EGSB]